MQSSSERTAPSNDLRVDCVESPSANAEDRSDFSSLSSSVLFIVFSSLSFFSLILNYIISLYSLHAYNGIMASQLIVLETFPNVSKPIQSFGSSLKISHPTFFNVHLLEHFLLQSKQIFSDTLFFLLGGSLIILASQFSFFI